MPKKKTSTRSTTKTTTTAAAAKPKQRNLSFLQLVAMFVSLFIVNSLVIYLANLIFPSNVVLGTHTIDPWSSLFMASLVLTIVNVGATPIIEIVSHWMHWVPSNRDWMILFFVINAVTLWVLGRMAEMIGIGFSSWFVVVVLAAVLDLVQGLVVTKVVMPLSNRGA